MLGSSNIIILAMSLVINDSLGLNKNITSSQNDDIHNQCSSPIGSMDSIVVVESENGDRHDFTTLQWQIRLGETLCYKFSEASQEASTIEVTYMNVRHVYSIANSYYFKLAKSNVQCVCDCPGGANACNTNTNSCNGKPNCVNLYSSEASSTGCFFRFLKLNAALCCSITIVPQNDRRLRAIELSVPTVIATFQVKHRNSDGIIVDSRVYNIDLNSGTSVDWEVSLQVGSAGPSHLLPPGWYIEDPRDSILLGNLPINALDEWDVAKLGWFKSRSPTEDHIDATGQQIIRQAFKVDVEDCGKNRFKYQFFRGFLDHHQLEGARKTQDMYPFIESISVWRRHVEITHRESPLMVMTMQHRNKVDVVMKYHESVLEDFSGVLMIDSHSNAFLNLTLINTMGSVHGTISTINYTQAVQVSVGNKFYSNYIKSLKVAGLVHCSRGQVRVSLRPYGGQEVISRGIPCQIDSLRHFRHVSSPEMNGNPGDLSRNCLSCSETWFYYMDPFNWADTLWNSTRFIITLIMIVIVLIILSLMIKCCLCLRKCGS